MNVVIFFFYINEKSLVIKLIEFKIITLLNKINIIINFENLTVELHIFYALNINIEFCVNLILFNIWSINLCLYIILNYKNLDF